MGDLKKILIVEDEEDLLEYLKLSLEDDYDVETVSTGKEFRKKFKKQDFDILILDVRLPDINGDVLAAEINKRNKSPKIILISTWDDVASRARRVGADGFLKKPFTIFKLHQVLGNVASI